MRLKNTQHGGSRFSALSSPLATMLVAAALSALGATANAAPTEPSAQLAAHGSQRIDKAALEGASLAWERTGQAAALVGEDGTVMYAYGQSRPVISCSPLHLCVVQLQHGEKVTDLSIGDSVRWRVGSSMAGDLPVIVIKPVASGLETNLTVTTDHGRIYYLTLRSADDGYVPMVGFYDPQAIVEHVNAQATAREATAQARKERQEATLGDIDPAKLDFAYTCTGDAPFKPEQVFSANGHVYLKMPSNMVYRDAPAVFNTSQGEKQLINSRLVRGYDILDGLPMAFSLVAGVGSDAQAVECEHKGHTRHALLPLFSSGN